MTLVEKEGQAKEFILETLEHYDRPIIMSSFGKDSMVMLELFKELGIVLPILFHKEPFFPKKYMFANRIIQERGYTVYDYPPVATQFTSNRNEKEIINWHQVGKKMAYLPTGLREPKEGEDFLCGLLDIYCKPRGTYEFPWDLVFVGHKSSDIDPILGAIPLKVQLRRNEDSADYALPLRYFTDADIWTYSLERHVPINRRRYNAENGWKEFDDITYNPDYFPACTACMEVPSEGVVWCPKFGKEIPGVSDRISHVEGEVPDYIGEA